MTEEEEKNVLSRENTSLNKKIREQQVALQELGREFQTLQVRKGEEGRGGEGWRMERHSMRMKTI